MKIKGKKIGKYVGVIFVCGVFAGVMLSECVRDKQDIQKRISKTSIFSWEEEYLYPEQERMLNQTMDTLDCGAVYQEVPDEVEVTLLKGYLDRRSENSQDVYYLAGQSEWGIEETGESMLQCVERTSKWNSKMDKGRGFTGIVFDVEPYLLDEWDADCETVMKQYVDNCIDAYEAAQRSDLIIILCIPNFYDRVGLSEELSRLVESGCDAIAVMNYNKEDEAGQIAEEAAIAANFQKGIIHITEMQKPGFHDLTDNNTYYNDGIEAVQKSWEKIEEKLNYRYLGFSWHYLKPIEHLLEGMEQS